MIEATDVHHTIDLSTATLEGAFAEASGGEPVERWFRVAGRTVLLRFAGPRLLHLTEAWKHLAVEGPLEAPSLTVSLWDAASTGVTAPLPPQDEPEDLAGEPLGLRILWFRPPVRAVHQPGQKTLTVLDESTNHAWFWCSSAEELPYWEHAAPLRLAVSWWLSGQHCNLVHAAAVGQDRGGALIVGRGGSGKSTTALLSLLGGLKYASDDYVGVEQDFRGQGPWVHSLYGSGKLDADQAARFPALMREVINADRLGIEKAVVLANRFAPDRMTEGFPLRAVLVPRITGQPATTWRPVPSAVALAALAPSTIFQLPGSPATDLKAMADLVRSVPTLVLELGSDFDEIPRAILRLLVEVEATAT